MVDEVPFEFGGSVPMHVGDDFPDVWAESTTGPIRLHEYCRRAYTLLLFHPGAYVRASEFELLEFGRAQGEFARRGARVLGLSQADAVTERMWLDEISARHGVTFEFPIIADEMGRIARACGLQHQSARTLIPVRRSVVIGPKLRVCAIWDYPPEVQRSPVEALRVIDALLARVSVLA